MRIAKKLAEAALRSPEIRIAKFNADVRAFERRTKNVALKKALDVHSRSTTEIVWALQQFQATPFVATDVAALVEIIKMGGSIDQVDRAVIKRLEDVAEARRLLREYAEIRGAPVKVVGELQDYDWHQVSLSDTVTKRSG